VTADSIAIDEALLALKIGFLVLLYLFIWRIVRSASRDIVVPSESVVLAPGEAPALTKRRQATDGRLVVVKSPTLPPGDDFVLNSAPLTVGRSGENDVELHGDGFASARHARIDARPDGVWLEDLDSTNGTFVNGIKLERPRKLAPGDVVRVGETDLRFDR
jgi:hypothetical protein